MKVVYLLFSVLAHSEKIIKNINIHPCRNCIHFKPYDNDFTSSLSLCNKFGEKNIISGEIIHEYADTCRNKEEKCGIEGKYFEEDKQIEQKIVLYKIKKQTPIIFLIFSYFSYFSWLLVKNI